MKGQLTWIEVQDSIGWIKINRERKLNALNRKLIDQLHDRIINFQNHRSVKVIVLTGSGDKAFVAGADISEFMSSEPQQAEALARHGNQVLFDFIAQLEKPVIAAINGYALGGGLELAMACHLELQPNMPKWDCPKYHWGYSRLWGTQRLPALIGKGKAMEMILTGDIISADKALELGLINQVVAAEKLLEATIILAKRLMKNSPNSIKNAIKAINASDSSLKGFKEENLQFSLCFGTTDFKEGVAAFLEKRKPEF